MKPVQSGSTTIREQSPDEDEAGDEIVQEIAKKSPPWVVSLVVHLVLLVIAGLITWGVVRPKATIEAGFVEPIDTERVEGYADTYELFRTAPGVNADGKVYGIPFTWGSIIISPG
ncbi:hypothetical protein DYH09_33380 [bacterium CPR1]|nr:hypothetical protein [bacterium CPR1]